MQKLLAPLVLFTGLLLPGPSAAAAGHHPAGHPAHASARPLVRYVLAELHLPAERATRVQVALQAQPQRLRTPEQVASRLEAVLTPAEYGRWQQLTGRGGDYEHLRFLAAR